MPAQLDDPATPPRYRECGNTPYPTGDTKLPSDIKPQQLSLRNGTIATLFPFSSPAQLPTSLIRFVCDMLGAAIQAGDTYPMLEPLPLKLFAPYWFGVFGTIMLQGDVASGERALRKAMLKQNENDEYGKGIWEGLCLGSFYTKPNYPGRSSHICNAGFLVAESARGKGVGKKMGEIYLDWAPKLGYTYSVFNLVYETNVASCRIWDSLGFDRIGRVPRCGDLKSSPGNLVDSIVYGKDLRLPFAKNQERENESTPTVDQSTAAATVV